MTYSFSLIQKSYIYTSPVPESKVVSTGSYHTEITTVLVHSDNQMLANVFVQCMHVA